MWGRGDRYLPWRTRTSCQLSAAARSRTTVQPGSVTGSGCSAGTRHSGPPYSRMTIARTWASSADRGELGLEQATHLGGQVDAVVDGVGDRDDRQVLGTRFDEGRELLRDLLGRPCGRDVLELLRRLVVERLHPPAEQLARTVPVRAEAAPHAQPEPRRCRTPKLGRGVADALDGFTEPASRAEDAQPAIAVRGGAPDGGVARAADDQRDPRVRRGQDAGIARGAKPSLVVHGRASGQLAKYLARFVQPAAALRGAPARVRDLAAVLAADTDPEYQPGGRYLGDGRELSRRHHGVPQSREVDTDEHLEG